MKALGITRNVDALGRIVIPKEVRKALNIAEGTAMEMLSDDNRSLHAEICSRVYVLQWHE